jgi:hypothetical protein
MKFTRTATVFGAAALFAGGAMVSYAAIPSGDGSVKACYAKTDGLLLGIPHSKGDVRIIDSGEGCRSYETQIIWNQEGLKGDQGLTGPQGPPGDPGEASSQRIYVAAVWGPIVDGDRSYVGNYVVDHPEPGVYDVHIDAEQFIDKCIATVALGETDVLEQGTSTIVTAASPFVTVFSDHVRVLVGKIDTPGRVDSSFMLTVVC